MTGGGGDAESRLTGLETALAHAEAALADLSDMVAVQAGEIESLRRDNRRLQIRIERLESGFDEPDEAGERFIP
ncbi:SlyX family protein [Magnetospirillum sp. SS-4]|uniref:SlyX family protein n=1 Tax=Magnetospirillum sp. SS-4 TaxID=2681465 RepID=UPI00137D37B1|nr:SlyX family protein [Magnetospirillum sp. SS-4]CAA7625203.1 conserved hypothetical protein [Magnetospirillum sp. SS-4]